MAALDSPTPNSPLRYAVLRHSDIADPHFDFLVETLAGSDLATWRSPDWPIDSPAHLTRLKDHRRIYLAYEGDLTDHRGRVERIAEGSCTLHIGENAVWTIDLSNRNSIVLRHLQGNQWYAITVTSSCEQKTGTSIDSG